MRDRHRLDHPSSRRGRSNPGIPRRADHHDQDRRLPSTASFEQAQLDSSTVEGVESASVDDHRVDRGRSNRGLQAPSPRCPIVLGRKDEDGSLEQPGVDAAWRVSKMVRLPVFAMVRGRCIDGRTGTSRYEIPRAGQAPPPDPCDVGRGSPEGVVFVSEAVKDADRRSEARHPVDHRVFSVRCS